MSQNAQIAAYTDNTHPYPAFINLSRREGKYVVTLRASGFDGNHIAEMEISKEELRKFFQAGLNHLDAEDAATSTESEVKYAPLDITFNQALELVAERSNGAYSRLQNHPGVFRVEGEWCLSELEGLTVFSRQAVVQSGFTPIGIAEAETVIDNEGAKYLPFNVTERQAQEYLDHRRVKIDGIDHGKGGRAWIDGEWNLADLEALCVVVRAKAGEFADGAHDTLEQWRLGDPDVVAWREANVGQGASSGT